MKIKFCEISDKKSEVVRIILFSNFLKNEDIVEKLRKKYKLPPLSVKVSNDTKEVFIYKSDESHNIQSRIIISEETVYEDLEEII